MKTCANCKHLDKTPHYEHGVSFIATYWNCLNVASDRFGEACCNKTTYGKQTVDTRPLQTCDKWEV